MKDAPLHADVADGPGNGRACWITTRDAVRLRVAVWNERGAKGTVLLLPGRTEYVEKYGRAAGDLARRGYCTISVDFRGQGLADRALADPMAGHVQDFAQYQHDIEAVMQAADRLGLPEPRFLMSHSMGGCIGLRALLQGLRVQAAAFSAPMWGISMAAWMRPVAQVLSTASGWFNLSHRYAPGTGGATYVLAAPFEANVLTSDPDMWAYMQRQVEAYPALALGGPSMGWLRAALAECYDLTLQDSPGYPAICALGLREKVVDPAPVHMRMARWPGARLDLYPTAEHEVIMETPADRARFFDAADALFQANA
jgi:lysophospholipase